MYGLVRSSYAVFGYGVPDTYTVQQYRPLASGSSGLRNELLQSLSPYRPLAGRRAYCEMEVLDGDPLNFDGMAFLLTYPLPSAPTATGTQGFTFDDDAPPPSTDSTIKIQGLSDTAAIAAQIILAINATETGGIQRFHARAKSAAEPSVIIIEQLTPGVVGNQPILVDDTLGGQLRVNDVTNFAAFDPLFHNGADISIAARFGKNYALLLTNEDTPESVPAVG